MRFSLGFCKVILTAVFFLNLTACGFHLRDDYNFPDEIGTLSVTSFDPYGNLAREMKRRLRLHHIELIEPNEQTANLRLDGENFGESTLSIYQNATVAQRQFSYTVNYTVTLPHKGNYRFSASLSRIYLDNPLTALAKSVEEEMLTEEMRIEATKQIMRQLAQLTAHVEDFEREQAKEERVNEFYNKGTNDEINVEIRFDGKE